MKLIEKEQALLAIRFGEFGDDIIRSAESVAVILTQSWCPQWHAMKRFVYDFTVVQVFSLEYDRTDYFDAFRRFKEEVFNNDQIPYIRYYRNGILTGESNAVSETEFGKYLEKRSR